MNLVGMYSKIREEVYMNLVGMYSIFEETQPTLYIERVKCRKCSGLGNLSLTNTF